MNKLALYLITLLGLCLTQPMVHAMSVQWTDYGYDNNGNVTELYDGDSGEIVGQYEYDPYGNTIKAEGQAARENKIRFSTKEYDSSTGLYYYGYRHYDPVAGRWPSRDPIGERGGLNLYGFVENNSISKVDILGLTMADIGKCCDGNGKTQFYDRATQCCYEKKVGNIRDTKVQKCTINDGLGFLPYHRYILTPSGVTLGGAGGYADSPDQYKADPSASNNSCNPVELCSVKYDIIKFEACIDAKAVEASSCHINPGGLTCIGVVNNLIRDCKKQAKN